MSADFSTSFNDSETIQVVKGVHSAYQETYKLPDSTSNVQHERQVSTEKAVDTQENTEYGTHQMQKKLEKQAVYHKEKHGDKKNLQKQYMKAKEQYT